MIRTNRWWKALAGGLLFSALAVPVVIACVIPRNLAEQVQLTSDEIAVGTIGKVTEISVREADGEMFTWTRVDMRVDESMVTGKRDFDSSFYFRGGVLPNSPTTSIAPSPDDIQVGRKLMVFLAKRPNTFIEHAFGVGSLQLDSYAECYRVIDATTSTSKTTVVLGKGDGFAFVKNVEIGAARAAIGSLVKKVK